MRTKDECIEILHRLDPDKYCPLICDCLGYYDKNNLQEITVEQMNEFIDKKIYEFYMNKRTIFKDFSLDEGSFIFDYIKQAWVD